MKSGDKDDNTSISDVKGVLSVKSKPVITTNDMEKVYDAKMSSSKKIRKVIL